MRTILTILIVLALSNPAVATPLVLDFSAGPVVFDFEDGLQGWVATGSAQRVNTQVLGGQWAIFGDGSANPRGHTNLFLDVDLTNVGSIVVEQFSAGDSGPPFTFARLGIRGIVILAEDMAATSNPGTWTLSSFPAIETQGVGILWIGNRSGPTSGLGFVDNITFFPLPEPSAFLLLSAALCSCRFRRASRIRC